MNRKEHNYFHEKQDLFSHGNGKDKKTGIFSQCHHTRIQHFLVLRMCKNCVHPIGWLMVSFCCSAVSHSAKSHCESIHNIHQNVPILDFAPNTRCSR